MKGKAAPHAPPYQIWAQSDPVGYRCLPAERGTHGDSVPEMLLLRKHPRCPDDGHHPVLCLLHRLLSQTFAFFLVSPPFLFLQKPANINVCGLFHAPFLWRFAPPPAAGYAPQAGLEPTALRLTAECSTSDGFTYRKMLNQKLAGIPYSWDNISF